jgi:hypothetical protein
MLQRISSVLVVLMLLMGSFGTARANPVAAVASTMSTVDTGYIAKLDAPINVQATDGDHTDKIVISWDAVTGTDYYKVFRWDAKLSKWVKIGQTTDLTFDDTGGRAAKVYKYRVKACNATGCSRSSAIDTGYIGKLSTPTNVQATDGDYTDKIVISWNAVSGADYYRVLRFDAKLNKWVKRGNATGLSFEDLGGKPLKVYKYRVKACNAHGCSSKSTMDSGYKAKLVTVQVVRNFSFELDGDKDGVPNNWTRISNDNKDARVCLSAKSGSCSFRFKGDSAGPADQLYQSLINKTLTKGGGNKDDVITLTFWARTKNLASTAYVQVAVYDAGSAAVDSIVYYLPVGSYGWTKFSDSLTVAYDSYDDLQVLLYFQGEEGEVLFIDNIKVMVQYVDSTP